MVCNFQINIRWMNGSLMRNQALWFGYLTQVSFQQLKILTKLNCWTGELTLNDCSEVGQKNLHGSDSEKSFILLYLNHTVKVYYESNTWLKTLLLGSILIYTWHSQINVF